MHTEHLVDDSQKEPTGEQSAKHLQDSLMEEFRLYASYWILDNLAFDFTLPIRHTIIEASFEDANGNLLPGFTSIHHRSETLFGLGDATAGLTTTAFSGSPEVPLRIVVRVGATLPTGGIEPDPFLLGAQGKDHQHIFYGTGTVNPTLGLGLSYDFGVLKLNSNTDLTFPVTSNREGYTPPTSFLSDLLVSIPTTIGSLNAVIGSGVFQEWPAKWGDKTAKNSGRTEVSAVLGVNWNVSEGFYASLSAKVPLYIEAKGGQLEMPLILQLALAGRVNLLD